MTSKTTNKFSSEVCARAVRMVQEHGGGEGPDIQPSLLNHCNVATYRCA